MKTTKYTIILLFLSLSCTSDADFDLVKIPVIEAKFGVNTYATIDDYITVEGIELGVDTTQELRAMHGNPENKTDEVDGLITWQYLSDGIGFEVNATTNIIEKVYLYTTLYQGYANNYIHQIQEDLVDLQLGTMKVIQVVDNVDDTITPANGTIQEATGGEINGVYYYDYEGIGRFIYISDSIDNTEGLVVQVIIGAVDAVVVGGDIPEISYVAATAGEQTFDVGTQDDDDLPASIATLTSATGSVAEGGGFIGFNAASITDDTTTGTFTFALSTDSATSINTDLSFEIQKRKGIITAGTVSVTGYADVPFSFASEGSATGVEIKSIDFGEVSLITGTDLTVTINLTSMLHTDSTQFGAFRLRKVIVAGDVTAPAQNTWLDVDNSITNIQLSTTCMDCSVATVANPDATDTEADNVTKWTIGSTSGSGNKSLSFDFNPGEGVTLADYANLTVTVRMYWPSFNDITNFDGNKRLRFYLSDGTAAQQKQVNFEETNEAQWHTVVFDFTGTPSGAALTSDVISGEIRLIGNNFTNLDNGLEFYIDTITYAIN